jgi:hypothetical protein
MAAEMGLSPEILETEAFPPGNCTNPIYVPVRQTVSHISQIL